MTVLLFILGILLFLLMLMTSVALHEGGHMAVAKIFKLNVPKFFIGFGKTLWSFKTDKTEYGIKMLPLGGFVQIEDKNVAKPDVSDLENKVNDETLSDEERKKAKKELKKRMENYTAEKGLLSHVEPWKRILVYLAGPAVNIVLGTALIYGVLMGFNTMVVNNTVETVNSCSTISEGQSCEAEKAGLQPGDTITAIDGNAVKMTENLSPYLVGKDEVSLTIQRGSEEINVESGVVNGFLGINLTPEIRSLTFAESTDTIQEVFVQNLIALSELPAKIPAVAEQTFVGGERDPEAPSSLVYAGKSYGDTSADMELPAKSKIQILLTYSALINLALGLLNLVFVLPLDGGRILIAIIDQFKIWFARIFRKEYRPVGVWEVTAMTATTGLMIFALMGLLMVSDVVNIIRGQI